MVGFERAHITQPGYAIEYDYFDPRDLNASLETKFIQNLFFAGQINGTTGYEEAGAQGLLAGLNAARKARDEDTWYPTRNEAYLGVLVDDLITRGVSEPYRMFTSRAEYRLLLREDNADLRLTPAGRKLGLVDDTRWAAFLRKRDAVEAEERRFEKTMIRPAALTERDQGLSGGNIRKECTAAELLRRPEYDYADVAALSAVGPGEWRGGLSAEEAEQVELQLEVRARYTGYIERQQREIDRHARQEKLVLPADLDYADVSGLSTEARQRLEAARPETLGHASRLEGVTPSTVSLILIHLRKRQLRKSA
jgi:tRNA uridine 5-carboxymethylaminomethyl modification enzyme